MRVAIIATGGSPPRFALSGGGPGPLLPLLDRPALQHELEFLVAQGFDEVHIVLCHYPEQIERVLGDGQRWGCRITYHLVRDPQKPYAPISRLLRSGVGPLLVGESRGFPAVAFRESMPSSDSETAVMFCHAASGEEPNAGSWLGWAWLNPISRDSVPSNRSREAFQAEFLKRAIPVRVSAEHFFDLNSFSGYVQAQSQALQQPFYGPLLAGRQVTPGIWLSRNVSLHPTATLVAPVYIGENCTIGPDAKLGPNVVLGADCRLEANTQVAESVILPGSHVGEGLELDGLIVDQNQFVNYRLGTFLVLDEDFILSSRDAVSLGEFVYKRLGQFLAGLVLVAFLPVVLFAMLWLRLFRRGAVWHSREVVQLPVDTNHSTARTYPFWSFVELPTEADAEFPAGIQHFVCLFLPGLVNVLRGNLGLIGVRPRSRQALDEIDEEWRESYYRGRAGLITEDCLLTHPPSFDELQTCDAICLASRGLRYDLGMLFRYSVVVLRSLWCFLSRSGVEPATAIRREEVHI